MKFGGSTFSSIEFSGRSSLVLFFVGCPLNCPYCHNPELVSGNSNNDETDIEEVFKIIDESKDYLDAVVFSGGEPLYQLNALEELLNYSKNLGLETKLDTSGIYPKKLKKILHLIDYIALDIKAPFDKYKEISGCNFGEKVKESMDLINEYNENNKIDENNENKNNENKNNENENNGNSQRTIFLECRTTYSSYFLSKEDIYRIAKEIRCDLYTIQQFRSKVNLDDRLEGLNSPSPFELKEMALEINSIFENNLNNNPNFKNISIKSAEFGNQKIIKDSEILND
ncbi:MAG: anaerobic ribonucleoside-triphosphate reductase activating protein [Methanobrevibacter sp.]|jgi:pyruvate formate lyase activating enzyme|nr:anaerobic ribonucleoside-triphosphate reductase activating protein [Candidatus Methanoflexus mossambicus]